MTNKELLEDVARSMLLLLGKVCQQHDGSYLWWGDEDKMEQEPEIIDRAVGILSKKLGLTLCDKCDGWKAEDESPVVNMPLCRCDLGVTTVAAKHFYEKLTGRATD